MGGAIPHQGTGTPLPVISMSPGDLDHPLDDFEIQKKIRCID